MRRDGNIKPGLRPLLGIAATEAWELIERLGGLEMLGPDQRALVENFCSLKIALRAQVQFPAQTSDGDAARRIGFLANARRANLAALGLGASASWEDQSGSDDRRAIEAQRQRAAEKTTQSEAQGSLDG